MIKIPADFEVTDLFGGTVGRLTVEGNMDGWTLLEVLAKVNDCSITDFGRSYDAIPGINSLTISGSTKIVERVKVDYRDVFKECLYLG